MKSKNILIGLAVVLGAIPGLVQADMSRSSEATIALQKAPKVEPAKAGVTFVNICDLDFGVVTTGLLGERIYNRNQLTVDIKDDRIGEDSDWTVAVRTSVCKDGDNKRYPLTDYQLDAEHAAVYGDGKRLASEHYETAAYAHSVHDQSFQKILTLDGHAANYYHIVWEPGEIYLDLGKDLSPGDYIITTEWQLSDGL